MADRAYRCTTRAICAERAAESMRKNGTNPSQHVLQTKKKIERGNGAIYEGRDYFLSRGACYLIAMNGDPSKEEISGAQAYFAIQTRRMEQRDRAIEDHTAGFRPTFLVNDILRFWKTLCLNYENRRNQSQEGKKIKQKIRNFKLGHSRLLTCFATVALLSNYNSISKAKVVSLCKMTPVERLLMLHDQRPALGELIRVALELYYWFLDKTAASPAELEEYFSDRTNRVTAFENAKKFGDQIFDIVKVTAEETGTFRYLVV